MKALKRVMENMKELQEVIKTSAPHGSGIDFDYNSIRVEHYSRDNQNKIIFENAYHCMNDNGYYDGIIPFRVVIGADLSPIIHFVGLTGAGKYRVHKYDLRLYLEETYYWYVNDCDDFLEVAAKIL